MNFQVDPTALVSSLGAAHKQMVEIARAVRHKAPHHHFRRTDRLADPGGKEPFLRPGAAAGEAGRRR